MPYGLKRFQRAEALHFIPFCCFHQLPFLEAPAPKESEWTGRLRGPLVAIKPPTQRVPRRGTASYDSWRSFGVDERATRLTLMRDLCHFRLHTSDCMTGRE